MREILPKILFPLEKYKNKEGWAYISLNFLRNYAYLKDFL